jgi:hypothetical protein
MRVRKNTNNSLLRKIDLPRDEHFTNNRIIIALKGAI